MHFSRSDSAENRPHADLLVLPYWIDGKAPVPAFDKKGWEIECDTFALWEQDFVAAAGEMLFSFAPCLEKRVVLLGLGAIEAQDPMALREAFAKVVALCLEKRWGKVNLPLPLHIDSERYIHAILDGFSMANYSFNALKREKLKEKPPFLVESLCLISLPISYLPLLQRQELLMQAVNLTRDLVCGNAQDVSADYLSAQAQALASKYSSIRCKVLRQKEIEEEQMGLLLAVNRGAEKEPALILLEYQGDPGGEDSTAVIGKGITFDTGGLNLKPTGSIETMRMDMAGAAAVLGIMQALAALGVKKNVLGVIAAAENTISHLAYRPGDVYISHKGKSVEISNTDAEGRLVLADALSYVQKEYDPSRIIDLATLTGGIVVALGETAAGLFCNDPLLTSQIKKAAEVVAEKVWEMPLFPEYRKLLKSSFADIKNASTARQASPCTGAVFLQQFIDDKRPWAHLDIAGTACITDPSAYVPGGVSGSGVRLVVACIEAL